MTGNSVNRKQYTPLSILDHRKLAFLIRRMRRDLREIENALYATGAPKERIRRILQPLSRAMKGLGCARSSLEKLMFEDHGANAPLNYYYGCFPYENSEEEEVKHW